MVRPLWITVLEFLKKLKLEPSYEPAIPLLCIYLKKIIIQEDYMQDFCCSPVA